MPTLSAKKLQKSYKSRRVVQDVSLTISNEIVGLLGTVVVGRHAAKRQFEKMQTAQAQQAQIQSAQESARQAQQAAEAAQAQQAAQAPQTVPPKKDPVAELQKLGGLKQQGLLTEEEYQKMKSQILAGS